MGCSHLPASERSYYSSLSAELQREKVGRPVVVIDLDRLDHNLEVVARHLVPPFHFRVSEKSVPSPDLINYILEASGSRRVMVFHHPFLKTLLASLPPDTDFLFGKTIPVNGLAEIFAQLDDVQAADATRRVQWLIDSPQTLADYLKFFRQRGFTFRANIEIDVGLHRGGVTDEPALDEILDLLRANKDLVTLSGLMGYDGHAIHFPAPRFLKVWSTRRTLRDIEAHYGRLWQHVRSAYPDLAATVGTLNGGGSSTYTLYEPRSVFDDLALGSALLKPLAYDLVTLEEHLPAVFIATPVLKKLHPAQLPFVGRISLNPAVDGYYLYGGGWASKVEYPEGLQLHPVLVTPPNATLVSNQLFVYGAADPQVGPGDFVFFRPNQSDTLFLFDEILLLRGGKLVGKFHPFSERY